jgi:hypothetical protein
VVPVKNRASRAVMVLINATMNESINLNGRILKLMMREKSDMRVDGKTVEQQQQKLANSLCTCDAPLNSSVGRQPMVESEDMESKTTSSTNESRRLSHKGNEGRYDCSC